MIIGLHGLPRSGKTLEMVRRCRSAYEAGGKVYVNFGLDPSGWKQNGGKVIEWTSLMELVEVEDCLIAADEFQLWADKQRWREMKRSFLYKLALSGHFGIDFIFTSQHPNDINTRIQNIVNLIIDCRKTEIKLTKKKSFLIFRQYEMARMSEFDKKKRKLTGKRWRLLDRNAAEAYNTRQKYYKIFEQMKREDLAEAVDNIVDETPES